MILICTLNYDWTLDMVQLCLHEAQGHLEKQSLLVILELTNF